jgi:AcrR family transcriptional regulator
MRVNLFQCCSVARMGDQDAQPLSLRERMKIESWYAVREAAYKLIGERGFEAVSVEDIAAAAGVSRATFFNYFPNKLAVVRDPAPGEREAWSALFDRPRDEPLWDSLVAVLVGLSEVARDQTIKVKRLYKRAPELEAIAASRTHPFYVDLRAFVKTRTPRGGELEASMLLNAALAMSDAAFTHWRPSSRNHYTDFLREAFARVTIEIVPRGTQ